MHCKRKQLFIQKQFSIPIIFREYRNYNPEFSGLLSLLVTLACRTHKSRHHLHCKNFELDMSNKHDKSMSICMYVHNVGLLNEQNK